MRIQINNRQAASGDSARKIAMDLNNDGVIPPLKYRVLKNGEKFSEAERQELPTSGTTPPSRGYSKTGSAS